MGEKKVYSKSLDVWTSQLTCSCLLPTPTIFTGNIHPKMYIISLYVTHKFTQTLGSMNSIIILAFNEDYVYLKPGYILFYLHPTLYDQFNKVLLYKLNLTSLSTASPLFFFLMLIRKHNVQMTINININVKDFRL